MAQIRQRTLDALLQLRASGLPQSSCARLAGVASSTLYRWLRQGDQLAVAAGEMDGESLERGQDVEVPADQEAKDQLQRFAVAWRQMEIELEPALVAQIRKAADGYSMKRVEVDFKPTEGKGGRTVWKPSKRREITVPVPGDWRAADRMLALRSDDYASGQRLSVELQREAEQMSEDELAEVLRAAESEC